MNDNNQPTDENTANKQDNQVQLINGKDDNSNHHSNTPFHIDNNTQENIAFIQNNDIVITDLISQANHTPNKNTIHPIDNLLPSYPQSPIPKADLKVITITSQGKIPSGPSYITQSNGTPIKVIELRRNCLDPSEVYFPFLMPIAISSLIINLFLPGIGTMIAAIFMSTSSFRMQFLLKGICELITSPCLIGWLLALYNSSQFIIASSKACSVEEYILNS